MTGLVKKLNKEHMNRLGELHLLTTTLDKRAEEIRCVLFALFAVSVTASL